MAEETRWDILIIIIIFRPPLRQQSIAFPDRSTEKSGIGTSVDFNKVAASPDVIVKFEVRLEISKEVSWNEKKCLDTGDIDILEMEEWNFFVKLEN